MVSLVKSSKRGRFRSGVRSHDTLILRFAHVNSLSRIVLVRCAIRPANLSGCFMPGLV